MTKMRKTNTTTKSKNQKIQKSSRDIRFVSPVLSTHLYIIITDSITCRLALCVSVRETQFWNVSREGPGQKRRRQ